MRGRGEGGEREQAFLIAVLIIWFLLVENTTYLDFERIIGELETRLASMEATASEHDVDLQDEVLALRKRVRELTKETFSKLTPWQRVQVSRHPNRPYTLDYLERIADPFVELHGDRFYGDDKALVGGLAQIGTHACVVIGQQKGRNTKMRQERNFGMAHPEGYRKGIRLMKLAEKFNRPVLTLIDTPGAYPGLGAEARGQAQAIAQSMFEMLSLRVPVVSVVVGEGASGGAIALAAADRVLMMENTWYSVISPESCSSILWRNWKYKEQAAEALKLTATDMHTNGLVDAIIEEPLGGAHRDWDAAAQRLKQAVIESFDALTTTETETLLANRREKFGRMGHYSEITE